MLLLHPPQHSPQPHSSQTLPPQPHHEKLQAHSAAASTTATASAKITAHQSKNHLWWRRLTAHRANASPFPSLMQGVFHGRRNFSFLFTVANAHPAATLTMTVRPPLAPTTTPALTAAALVLAPSAPTEVDGAPQSLPLLRLGGRACFMRMTHWNTCVCLCAHVCVRVSTCVGGGTCHP